MTVIRWCVALWSVIPLLATAQTTRPSFPLWEGLTPGTHQVGFRSFWKRDWTRAWAPPVDAAGRPLGVAARPVRMNLWYPAAPSSGSTMRFRDYVGSARTAGFADVEEMVSRADLGAPGDRGLRNLFPTPATVDSLFATRVAAHRDAPFEAGRFPVVVYALGQGDYTQEDVPFCEYLASRGYVVVSVSQLGTSPRRDVLFIHDQPSYDAQVQDLGFALANVLNDVPSADSSRVGAVGMSMGGVYSLLLALRTPVVRVVVGLDPSYVSEMVSFAYRYWAAPEFDGARFRGDILTLYRQDSTPRTHVLDSLHLADRLFLRVPAAVHTDFTGYPEYARHAPLAEQDSFALAHRPPATAAANYVAWVSYATCYLDDRLAHRRTTGRCAAPREFESESLRPATGPTEEELYTLMRLHGVPAAVQALARASGDSSAWHLRRPVMRRIVNELGYAGRRVESAQYARLLAEVFRDAEAYEQLGDAWSDARDVQQARAAYTRALALEPARASARAKLDKLDGRQSPAAEQSSIADRLDRYTAPLVQAHELSGSFLVARAGRTLAERSYGMANREHAVAATSDTRYVIGSISKELTAAAIVLLAQQGRLGLDDHLDKYLPGFPSGDAITLRQMLRHTSGISRDLPTLGDAVVPHSPAELAAIIERLPLASAPGARYGYSNNAYKLLAYVIERVSGESYARYLARSFFEPLGMTDTGELAPLTLVPHLASGYAPGFGPDGFGPAPHLDISNNIGAASLYSTPRDLVVWSERFLLQGFPYPKVRDTLLANGGLGVGVATRNGHRVISHDGVWQGYTSFAATYPDEQLTVIYLGNTETAASVSPLQAALDSIVHGADVAPPTVIPHGAPIPPDRMSDYVGRYDFFPGLTATIRRMHGTLVLGVGEGEYPLEWVGDDRMFFRLKHASVSFTRAASGRVTALEWREAGNVFPASRVE